MKKTSGAALLLGLGLTSGCSMQNTADLSVHEALFYGGNQQRVAWVYGNSAGEGRGLKLGGVAVTLGRQVQGDPLALPGTLSVNGKATYRGSTGMGSAPSGNRVNVARGEGGYSVSALGDVEAVYATDGRTWTRLSGPISGGQSVRAAGTPSAGLRGAGELTDPEADALSRELLGQGPLEVAVLPAASLPDAPLSVEPALDPGRHPVTGLYVQTGVTITTAALTPAPVTPGASVSFRELAGGNNAAVNGFQVVLARTAAGLSGVWGLGYGRQTPLPPLPTLAAGHTLVGVFLGTKPTGGYGVSVASARRVGTALELSVNVKSPGPGTITTQALTSPWTLVEVSGSFSSVVARDATSGKELGTGKELK